MDADIVDFHYGSRESLEDPWERYAQWRAETPVVRTEAHGGYWLLTRYDDIVAAACDAATYSSANGVSVPKMQLPVPLLPFEIDPPRHPKVRAVVMRHFTPRALADFTVEAERVCESLAGPLAMRERVELMDEYVLPMACLLFAEHLGVPRDEQEQTIDWLRAWATPPYDPDAVGRGLLTYNAYLTDLAESGRMRPDSLLADVQTADIDGVPLSETERHGLRFTLLLAGVETTLFATGNAILLLAADPNVQRQLAGNLHLVPAAVEECLRLDGPAAAHTRTLTRDVELHGTTMRAGDRVALLWACGNRDESMLPAGTTFDLEHSSSKHLAFGVGPHRCAGAPLARIEMQAALTSLLRHVPLFRLAPDDPVVFFPPARGTMRLPILTS